MKIRRLILITFFAILVIPFGQRVNAAAQDEPDLSSPKFGAWGFDVAGQDSTVKPGDDFFRFANGGWLLREVIPADRVSYGMFHQLRELSDARVKDIVEHANVGSDRPRSEALISTLFRSFMEEEAIERADLLPLQSYLDEIRRAESRKDIARLMGKSAADFYGTFIGVGIGPDAKHPMQYVKFLQQAGIGLPDRDYYLDKSFAEKKKAYRTYVQDQLRMIGWPGPDTVADSILDLETKIARSHWTRVQSRDDVATYNPVRVSELISLAPTFPWQEFLESAGLTGTDHLVLVQKSAIVKIAQVFSATPIQTLKAWEAFSVVDAASPYLPSRFVNRNFEFRRKELEGQPENGVRWKRGVTLVNGLLPDAIGSLYVQKYYTPQAQEKMRNLISNLEDALRKRFDKLGWMSDSTKQQALAKLEKFKANIGGPIKYRSYGGLTLDPELLFQNIKAATSWEWNFEIARSSGPVDRDDWGITPQTVNAEYRQPMNDITFPAAILQPPFFDPDADPAVNYGAIGAAIGHEITHGFDDQGRRWDGTGTLRNWWTTTDENRFQSAAKKLGDQFARIPVLPGAHINPDLTMGENIADLGGILMAFDAYKTSLAGRPAPIIEGLTGDQRFFLGFAQIWRAKYRDDFAKELLVSDPHSPPGARVNGTVRNVDAWYEAWRINPGDSLYVAPEKRVRIW